MYGQDVVLRLIGLIYESALDPERWQIFLDQLSETVDGHSSSFWSVRPDTFITMLAVSGFDPAFLTAYNAHYAQEDPWIVAARKKGLVRPGVVRLGEQLVPAAELRKTGFFNDLGKKHQIIGGLAAVYGPDGAWGLLSLSQRQFGQFGEREYNLMTTLSAHLERAMAIGGRVEAAAAMHRTTADVMEHLPVAAVVVDRLVRPMIINAAARAMLGTGLVSTKDGLVTKRVSETRALRDLVSACGRTQSAGGLAGGTMTVSRAAPLAALQVTVMPIRRAAGIDSTVDSGAALIIVRDPGARPLAGLAILQQLHGLTPAEARIATALADGHTVGDIAGLLSITPNTIRTHLKRIFHKTETRTQAQLVRVLLTGLAPSRAT